jgi:glyoxylase-like metal-dependent hydrolase (beta-lactamase superfamily II)/rhodanese-related sulfurtransferase
MDVITVETPQLGDRSYLVHDGALGIVVDPQRDIDRMLAAAERAGVRITHVLETHLHNDYVSGGLALAGEVGAEYVVPSGVDVDFERTALAGEDTVRTGTLTVRALETPGHTPHHLSYLVGDGQPQAVLTGGSLLYGTVGRTDLLGAEQTDKLTRAQFESVRRLLADLQPDVSVHPTHGFGSFCSSAASSDRDSSTIATEQETNLAATADSEDAFVSTLLSGLTDYPAYYARMAARNRAGAASFAANPLAEVGSEELRRRIEAAEWAVDLRDRVAFAAQHLAGTVGVELSAPFSTYLGWLLPESTDLTLVGERDQAGQAQRDLSRIGVDELAGAATAPVDRLADGAEMSSYPVSDFPGLAGAAPVTVLDVRRDDEWRSGHIDGALHVPLHDLLGRMHELPGETLWVHCASGFRSSIAASLLDRAGHDVVLVDDDWNRAEPAGLPVVP